MPIYGTIYKNMFKLVIFDLDGTLLDTIEDLTYSVNHALSSCGFRTITVNKCRQLVGHGVRNLIKDALPEDQKTDEIISSMLQHFHSCYREHMADFTRPYEGIVESLQKLKSEGLHLAIASNKFQSGTEELAEKFFGNVNFVKILGQREGYPIKPDAGIVYEIMKEIPGISKEEVLYCGDSEIDMKTGLNAGVKTLGVTWGFRTREQLMSFQPWKIIDDPKEIYNTIVEK